jgi:hypothetical protein
MSELQTGSSFVFAALQALHNEDYEQEKSALAWRTYFPLVICGCIWRTDP